MKPNFALSLSFDGLRLMHRAEGGWQLVGQVALDDADMTGALARLHRVAMTLEPGGVTTKLLIPNDQIKYLALDTTRAEEDNVREALQGATPYPVDQLAYDFAKGGGRTYIAAVARETLDEAEQFAVEHGFNPVSFAAIPEPFTYVGEAFFGATRSARPNQTAERDDEPVIVTGDAALTLQPAPEPPTAEQPAPDPAAAAVPESAPEPVTVDEAPVHPEPKPQIAATPDPAPILDPEQSPDTGPVPEPDVVADVVVDQPPEPDGAPQLPADVTPPIEATIPPAVQTPAPEPQHDPVPDAEPEVPAPMFTSRLRADRSDGVPPAKTAPPPPRNEPRAEPAMRRATEPAAPTLAVPTDRGTDAVPPLSAPSRTADAGLAAGSVSAPVATAVPTDVPQTDVAPPITGEAPTALPPGAAVAAASLTVTPQPSDVADPEPTAGAGTAGRSAAATALGAATAVGGAVGGMFASRRMAHADAKTAADADPPADDKPSRSVFGARKQAKAKTVVGGKPRFLGLILTAVLLIFLMALAAFAAMSEDGIAGWFGLGNDETQIAAEPDETPPDQTPTATLTPELDDGEVAAQSPADTVAAAPNAPALPTPPSGGQILSPEQANRIYAATGVWQRAPRIPQIPRTTNLDALTFGTAPSPVPRVPSSPLASANSVAADPLIATPIDPPAPDQTFNFGDDGLIVATQDGAVTPDGTLIVAGRPSLEPPTRPGTVAPEVTPQDQLSAVIPNTATTIADAPEGLIVIAGRPVIEPPVRTGTTPPAPTPQALSLGAGVAPLLSTDGLLVLAGTPSILPPARPGTPPPPSTPVTPAALAPAAVPENTPEEDTVGDLGTPDAPDTALLPEGLNIVTGTPPVLPPVRPGTVAPPTDAALDTLTLDVAAALTSGTAQTPNADTPRPLTRPAAITRVAEAAAAAALAAERAAQTPVLGALTVAQAAAFRPLTRPAGLAPEAVTAAVAAPVPVPGPTPEAVAAATAPASLQISPAIAAAVAAANARPNPIVNPTALAVPVSRVPDLRPRNMARIVERATAANARAAQQVAAARVAPQATAPQAVAPSGPTGSAVAQNATLTNAINMRDVNLIGIYGGDSDRRALIRLANGRYQRVTVGDRLDGGRVTAISAGALSYTKRGRALTLQVAR